MRTSRDIRSDLMRMAFMFMICLVHSTGCIESRWTHPLANVSFAGVLGFVLISGYYGVRFTWLKVLKLEATALFCAAFVTFLGEVIFHCSPSPLTFTSYTASAVSIWKSYWFIHSYVLLMCLAPLVPDIQTFKHSSIQTFLPLILAIYGWSFLTLIPGIQAYVPRTPGLEPFSGVTLFAVYLIGRLYRAYDWDRLSPWLVYPVAIVGGFLAAISGKGGLGWAGALARYNTPTMLVFSFGLFYALRRFGSSRASSRADCNNSNILNSKIQTFLSLLTPSVLSVYLLHCNDYGREALVWFEQHLISFGFDGYPEYFVLAFIAFVGGFVLDLPRRLASALIRFAFSCLNLKL